MTVSVSLCSPTTDEARRPSVTGSYSDHSTGGDAAGCPTPRPHLSTFRGPPHHPHRPPHLSPVASCRTHASRSSSGLRWSPAHAGKLAIRTHPRSDSFRSVPRGRQRVPAPMGGREPSAPAGVLIPGAAVRARCGADRTAADLAARSTPPALTPARPVNPSTRTDTTATNLILAIWNSSRARSLCAYRAGSYPRSRVKDPARGISGRTTAGPTPGPARRGRRVSALR